MNYGKLLAYLKAVSDTEYALYMCESAYDRLKEYRSSVSRDISDSKRDILDNTYIPPNHMTSVLSLVVVILFVALTAYKEYRFFSGRGIITEYAENMVDFALIVLTAIGYGAAIFIQTGIACLIVWYPLHLLFSVIYSIYVKKKRRRTLRDRLASDPYFSDTAMLKKVVRASEEALDDRMTSLRSQLKDFYKAGILPP